MPADVPVPIRARMLGDLPHGFLGRRGGVSGGRYASLNAGLGSGDDPAAVAENRRRAAGAVLPAAPLVTPFQVHSAEAAVVTTPFADEARPRVDALVTATPGLLLGILTADCVPVLLADMKARVVGAVHAGWKGALGGVTDAAVAAMVRLGANPAQVVAAIGPCIARASYEVGDDFALRFAEADPANERFFAPGRRPDRQQFDIEAYVAARLAAAGVRRVEALGLDTCADAERFFSYRRACLGGEADYGRQVALIGLPG